MIKQIRYGLMVTASLFVLNDPLFAYQELQNKISSGVSKEYEKDYVQSEINKISESDRADVVEHARPLVGGISKRNERAKIIHKRFRKSKLRRIVLVFCNMLFPW